MGFLIPTAVALTSVVVAFYLGPQLAGDEPLVVDVASRMDGRRVLVTGGSSGVGLAAAQNLASRGATVYLTGRSEARVKEAAETLEGGRGVGMVLDLTSADSVDSFGSSFTSALAGNALDVVIFNAGMFYDTAGTGPYLVDFNGSKQDTMVAANHLGHFKLLKALLPTIVSSSSRVVFTSSISHQFGTADGVLPANGNAHWAAGVATEGDAISPIKAFRLYGETKLMNVLTANKLQRLLDADESTSASVVVCTPGFVATNIGSNDRASDRWNPIEYIPLARDQKNGGMVLAFATTVEEKLTRGKMLQPYWIFEGARNIFSNGIARGFFYNFVQEMFMQRLTPAGTVYAHVQNDFSYDEDLQDSLWQWSEAVVG
eukprot:TRINITY_DN24701_c0_g1_i1.p1 TRINITY_DN24701_c0_g1~~TRINITY_DN24701_c0_g1_i1.p1  ORF type:complete len:373 (-),score=78.37 TRINITY_DN24701_c0_g1_i1:200-1318(-)